METMTETNIAAFFDFDKTLVEVESARMGAKWLWDKRIIPLGYMIRLIAANLLYKRDLFSEERMGLIALSFYRNKRLSDFQKYAEEFYLEYLKPNLAPRILARLHVHRNRGHVLVLISGSLRYYLEPVVKDLGFHHLLCTDLEVGADGLLTGNPKGPLCIDANKRRLASDLAEKAGLDLQRSYAYGNHQADIPMLELVGFPHVVEPTVPLQEVANKRSWPILSYR
jgi:HAD superfamily hydrolase (TIGR01490 family)